MNPDPGTDVLAQQLVSAGELLAACDLEPADVLDHLPLAVTVIDPELHIVYANRASEAIFARKSAEVVGHDVVEVAIPPAYASEATRILRLATEGVPWQGEFPVTRGDGSQVVGSFVTAPVVLDGKTRHPIVNVFRDATLDLQRQQERERALETERSSRQVLEAVLDSVQLGLAFFDREHRWTLLNQHAAALSGRPAAGLVGVRMGEVSPEAEQTLGPLVDQVFATGAPVRGVEGTNAAPGAPDVLRHWEVSCYPLSLPSGEDWVGVVVLDVTDRFERELERLVLLEAERTARLALEQSAALLDTALESSPVGMCFFDRELRWVRTNSAASRMLGIETGSRVGQLLVDVLPRLAHLVRPLVEEVFATGSPVGGGDLADPSGSSFWEVNLYPVRFGGKVEMVGVVSMDVTDRVLRERERTSYLEAERAARSVAEEAQRRLAFLAEASATLDASLEFDGILTELSPLAVPFLADVCVVEVVEEGVPSPAVVTTPDPEGTLEARRLRSELGVPAAVTRCLASGAPELLVAPEGPYGRECSGLLVEPWGVVVPLRAREGLLGALVLLREGSGRVLSPEDVALAVEFGRRAGLALDNARLYELRSEVARHLQASLLPSSLPQVPNATVAVRYVAATDGMDVGGDFYDLFAADGGWALTVGDVCGRGPAAAAMTGLARHTLRAAARREPSPSRVLAELNEAILNERPDAPYCTVVHGRLTPTPAGGFSFNLACGGHPLPLVLRVDGSVEEVGEPGTIIGSFDEVDLPEATVELFPGDTLVCFTDGVIERRNPLNRHLFGDERLADTLAGFAGCRAEEVLDGLALALDAWGGEHPDDTAIVVLQVSSGGSRLAARPLVSRGAP